MYLVSLKGKDVFQGNTVICVITQKSSLSKVRDYIKQEYDIEFADYPTCLTEDLTIRFSLDWWCFDNITDDRDISLVVETVYTEADIDVLFS